MINAFRYGFLGYSDISVGISMSVIIGFCIGLFSLAYYLVSRGIGLRS